VFVLAAGVAGMWGLSATINVLHQLQQQDDYVLAAISGASDILKAAAALSIIFALRKWLPSVFLAALVIWLSCTAWSVYSGFGYLSTKMVVAEDSRALRHETDQSLVEEVKKLSARIDMMRATTVRDTKERLSQAADIQRAERRLDGLRAKLDTREGAPSANPVGKALHTYFGWSADAAAIAKILIFLAVLEFGSNLGLVAFSHFLRWPPQVWDDGPTSAPAAAVLTESNVQKTNIAPQLSEPPKPPIHLIAANTDAEVQMERFVRWLGKQKRSGAIALKEAQALYAVWCQQTGERPLVRPALLGQGLVKHGATKGAMNKSAPTYVLPKVS
jgi:hypothetical protein